VFTVSGTVAPLSECAGQVLTDADPRHGREMAMSEQFEKDKICYEQNCEMFRSLNQIMWQVPLIAMTLTGGLWFGVSIIDGDVLRQSALLLLATVGNFALCVVLWRVRYIMGEYLQQIRSFNTSAFVDARGAGPFTRPKVVIGAFMVMLLTAGTVSAGFAVYGLCVSGRDDKASAQAPDEELCGIP